MPIPKPVKGETQTVYMRRCVTFLESEKTPKKQAVAICLQEWGRRKKKEDTSVFSGLLLKGESDG